MSDTCYCGRCDKILSADGPHLLFTTPIRIRTSEGPASERKLLCLECAEYEVKQRLLANKIENMIRQQLQTASERKNT